MTDEARPAPHAGGKAGWREGPAPVGGHQPDPDLDPGCPLPATHASFFSGVGGLDLGLERAGWRTVSFSEKEPYASAQLAQRWPGVPNIGDITTVEPGPWTAATLWSGGFPCQDLSHAGRRAGFTGERSVLAFTFLDLVGQYKPPLIVLENVVGLLTSNLARDMARLTAEVADRGYGVAWRVLDSRYFGVPQRRRRVFLVGVRESGDDPDGRLAAYRAGTVLSVATCCPWHPPTGRKKGAFPPPGARRGPDESGLVGALPAGQHGFPDGVQEFLQGHFIPVRVDGEATYPYGGGATDGVARQVDGRGGLAFVKGKRPQSDQDHETWIQSDVMPTLNGFDVGDTRTTAAILGTSVGDDDEPAGLDSHRYRCIGNGVVSPVAEWLGRRLLAVL